MMNKSTNVVRDKMASVWLFTWFQNNSIKADPDKFHLLLTDTDYQGMEVCNNKTENSFYEKLLGTKIDTKLKLEKHVETMSRKASQKKMLWKEYNLI